MAGKIIELNVIATNQNRLKISKTQLSYKTRGNSENVLKKTILQQAKNSYITHQRDRKRNSEKFQKFLSCFLNLI